MEFPQPVAYMVMRPQFDRWLVGKAVAAGARLHEGESVIALRMYEGGVEVNTNHGRYQGRFVVGADGVRSLVAQHLFPGRRFHTIPALESEYHGIPLPSSVHTVPTAVISLTAAEKGYGWVFPKHNGLSFGVGEFVKGANRPRRSFDLFVRNEKSLEGLSISPPLGHPLPIAYQRSRNQENPWKGNLVRERALLVGDAGHLVDPLLGEGIYYAVRSGQLAAVAVFSALRQNPSHLQHYEESINKEFGQEFYVAAQLSRIIYGLPRSVHRWAGRTFPHAYQRVLRRYCEVLQGRETYQGLWRRMTDRLAHPFARRR
ncbi:MAG: NAD(P)/FAD-dependent oxidoreductase [Nitrospirales bacterium]|nr:NAD(P)/FAD-dependent oxidoreductase [Nitrospirales bacterium]